METKIFLVNPKTIEIINKEMEGHVVYRMQFANDEKGRLYMSMVLLSQ